MPRLRRYLPPLLILLPLILVCGKILLTPIDAHIMVGAGFTTGPRYQVYPERGWPWLYQQAGFQSDDDEIVWPSCQTSNYGFSIWLLLADIAVLSIPVAVLAILLCWWRSRSGSWWRFSLRGLMIWVAIAAVGCGWWAYHDRQYRQEQKVLGEWDASLGNSNDRYDGPQWLFRLVPEKHLQAFHHVAHLYVTLKATEHDETTFLPPEFWAGLPRFPSLRALDIRNDDFLPPGVRPVLLRLRPEEIKQLDRIVRFDCVDKAADDETLRQIAQLPRLRAVMIQDCPITGQGLAALRDCRTLETIRLSCCHEITDEGVDALFDLPRLKHLEVMVCDKLTPEAMLRRMAKFPDLIVSHNLDIPKEPESSEPNTK